MYECMGLFSYLPYLFIGDLHIYSPSGRYLISFLCVSAKSPMPKIMRIQSDRFITRFVCLVPCVRCDCTESLLIVDLSGTTRTSLSNRNSSVKNDIKNEKRSEFG